MNPFTTLKQWLIIGALTAALVLSGVLYFKAGQRAANAEHEAKSMGTWSDVTCALTGAVFRTADMKRTDWGKACQARIQYLATFEHDTKDATNKVLEQHIVDQGKKSAADVAAARRAAASAAGAVKKMEKANADVHEDRVGAVWFGALNELGGLRAPTTPSAP